ncbi:uncharacterized protein LOC130890929 [Diorhabda carinulata]|uniref:uncharacterized protein LOC130890929 n=1 Tax=Diorhabda carinulata TaxID=1163345 RepID=UPI0025A21C9E|nr:uncharacterized protein LOC130890929 [Diorhabda carinulata]
MDLEDLKFTCAIAPQTLQLIIMETCSAIIKALKENIQVPKTTDGWKRVAQEFEEQWNFPNCVGSTDGKHVSIQKPPHSGSYYFNYKGFFSIVLMAIVDANYKFLMVDVGANGRVSDGGVLKNTCFGTSCLRTSLTCLILESYQALLINNFRTSSLQMKLSNFSLSS